MASCGLANPYDEMVAAGHSYAAVGA